MASDVQRSVTTNPKLTQDKPSRRLNFDENWVWDRRISVGVELMIINGRNSPTTGHIKIGDRGQGAAGNT